MNRKLPLSKFDGVKVLVLDFDNCLVLDQSSHDGSEKIKDKAWLEVFSEYDPGIINSILESVKKEISGGRGDRKDFVERVCRNFGVPESEINKEIIRRCNDFDKIVQEGIKEMGIPEKVRHALSVISKRVPIYINSATPRDSVLKSLEMLKMTSFFKGVYGRPGTKLGNMQDIINAESVNPKEVLFVDDQESSRAIAKDIGCRFIGVYTSRNNIWHSYSQSFPLISSIEELLY